MEYWGKFKSCALAFTAGIALVQLPIWDFEAGLDIITAAILFIGVFFEAIRIVDEKDAEIRMYRETKLRGGYKRVGNRRAAG